MQKMIVTKFECLPIDVLFEIFAYLSPVEILQSFLSLSKCFSTIVLRQHLWHIHIGGNTMSLSMFKNFCQNVLKLIGDRVISLRITFSNMIGGWSLVASSLNYHQTILLRRLHLIDIESHEFDKLLRNHLVKQLHTLLVDVTKCNSFKYQVVEGAYLAKVCSCLPALTICQLPFDFCPFSRNQLSISSAPPLMTLPNLSNTTYLHTLTTGINTLRFLERLIECIPFIENLSVGVQETEIYDDDKFDIIPLPVAVDARFLRRLSHLKLHCMSKRSFHKAIALLSSVFGQLTHLSLKLNAYTSISGALIISGDTIQQLCIDRLKPSAIYTLNLSVNVIKESEEKIIFTSFVKASFARRERPKVFVQELDNGTIGHNYHCFIVYTAPYNDRMLPTYLFSTDLEKCV
ncbi:unnamed protein product [Rotaria sp. Silwood2]|nr:unnamed protein product [Rotaria sp. Silwood2]